MTDHRIPDPDNTDDSLVGVPSHPVSTLTGALIGGAATGAVVGTAAGPVGTAIGAVVGAVIGGMGGDAVASSVEQVHDADHWRATHAERRYVGLDEDYDLFDPAYRYGSEARARFPDQNFEEVEPTLQEHWIVVRGTSSLEWDRARDAVRDSWEYKK